ncbi:Uncharacterized conserved protein YgbK, DUF1537 family [Xaviernesmea oryzae]|uniref:3-oxo-tetronate kinase n=1 Tax=Xaviernesmea oryzae TaxID=464029 RepID=A0A1X7E258_9HYPH|nr:3-oxo-tetronate kinase [Xaviernesmea oryzae]SMF25471.1 Uncharacterized conserved protein YgbK, DUF1537 family [Xaviernesmea oryzae]
MLLGVIADDFTGAGDIANTLAKGLSGQGGLRVTQYMGVPDEPADPSFEAGVISLKTRSVPASEAVALSLKALAWLKAQGCRQIIYKYCSTFDSTPAGNIGPVGEALAKALGVKGVVACPAFPTLGRTVHQGHLFVHDRLLNESGMQDHPLTPMIDPDIRRWLGRQTLSPVGLVGIATVRSGADAVRAALAKAAGLDETLIIVDAATDEDLVTIGRACSEAPLMTGGSGIALGVPANFIASGDAKGGRTPYHGIDGAAAILAGSCSGATREQIDVYARNHPVYEIDVGRVMSGKVGASDVLDFMEAQAGAAPLAYSSGSPVQVAAAQTRYGREALAERLDELFAEIARRLIDNGVKRLVVAGGETSGAVAQALNLSDLEIGPEIDPGVPILINHRLGIALALKSGNFGEANFFEKALLEMTGKEV